MSSECWVEPSSEESMLEKQRREAAEKEEVEVPSRDNQFAESLRQKEELGGKRSSSPDHRDMQEVTSKDEPEQVQRVEGKTSEKTDSQKGRQRESGACVVEQNLQWSLTQEPRGPGPFFFVGGKNGAQIVSGYCESRGWIRIYDKRREDFRLKWCETKSPANYRYFREGEQLVYQIPNNKVLTTKIGLLSSLREYERVSSKVSLGQRLRRLKMEDFIPTTFRMDVTEEREAFFAQQEGGSSNESHMWICKPTGLNQGRGIFLLKNLEDVAAFRLKLQHMEERQASRKMHQHQPQALVVQHYIKSPLLLKGKKFDVRSYLLIACTAPYMVFFRHGYVRLTCDLYDPSSNNLSAHLTNQYMQKKNPQYNWLKEDTVWSMESFNTYVNDRFQVAKGLPRDWVLGVFAKRMQQIMMQCFCAVKAKLDCRLGFFDLIGCDFMIDQDFKVWLLEMNCNPALHTNCGVLREVIPSTVVEALDLTLEIFNKCRLRQTILPLVSQREFVLLYHGVHSPHSGLDRSKRNTNTVFNQKSSKKTEHGKSKSGTEEQSPDNSSGEQRSRSQSGCRSNTSATTSPLHPRSLSVHTVRTRTPRPRVELKLKNHTFHHHLKAADEAEDSKTQQKTKIIRSVREGLSVCCSLETPKPPRPPAAPPLGGKGSGWRGAQTGHKEFYSRDKSGSVTKYMKTVEL